MRIDLGRVSWFVFRIAVAVIALIFLPVRYAEGPGNRQQRQSQRYGDGPVGSGGRERTGGSEADGNGRDKHDRDR